MKSFELIAFDIDGTLTESKSPLDSEMAGLLARLLERYKVAIISGAALKQFQWQILDGLTSSRANMKNLYLLPVDGTVACRFDDKWQCQHDDPLSADEKGLIRNAFENIFERLGLERPKQTYGELMEDRGAQLNFSALGQDAPAELKKKWDPDNSKRKLMIGLLGGALKGFSMRVGGTTSIEITKEGVDKAYGLKKLMNQTGIAKENMLYVGDKLFKGGNDAPALEAAGECRSVTGPEETKKIILRLLEQD